MPRALILSLLLLALSSSASAAFSFSDWDRLVQTYVTGDTVDYHGLSADQEFSEFLERVASANASDVNTSPQLKASFYINAYNALASKLIIENPCRRDVFAECGPLRSIKEIGSLFSSVWDRIAGMVTQQPMSLAQIESTLMAEQPATDGRLRVALVCGAVGAPALRNRAFQPGLLEAQLNISMRTLLENRRTGLRLNTTTNMLLIHEIFVKHKEDFVGSAGTDEQLLLYLVRFMGDPFYADYIAAHASTLMVNTIAYNWDINGVPLPCSSSSRPCYTWGDLLITIGVLLFGLISVGVIAWFIKSKRPYARMGVEQQHYWRNWIAFWLLGTINNLFYVVVGSAAQSLANAFNEQSLFGLIIWANIALGLVSRGINTWLLEGVPVKWRILACSIFNLLGLVGVAFSSYVNFWFLLSAIVVIGACSSFGESVFLGYMRAFPSEIVNGWSSGTGMAGVGGSLMYIGLVAIGLSNEVIFLALTPMVLVYLGVYWFMLVPPSPSVAAAAVVSTPAGMRSPSDQTPVVDALAPAATRSQKRPLLADESLDADVSEGSEDENGDQIPRWRVAGPVESGLQRNVRCLKLVAWRAVQLALVYFFEYVASTGGANRALSPGSEDSSNWAIRNSYIILSFCYQLGVFLSRSSLQYIKIRRIEWMTALQGVNMVYWLLQGKFKLIEGNVGVWFLFLIMIYVGLLGGGMYVNCFYLILNDDIPRSDRELCINITAIFVNLGIMGASLFIILADATFLKGS